MEFVLYQNALKQWLAGQAPDDHALRQAGADLCRVARSRGFQAEELVVSLRGGAPAYTALEGTDRAARRSQEQSQRATRATRMLLDCYFA